VLQCSFATHIFLTKSLHRSKDTNNPAYKLTTEKAATSMLQVQRADINF